MSGAFDAWVGKTEVAQDCVTARQARQMAATLDVPGTFADGDPLPPLWHWMGWPPDTPTAGLGPDGHPARGGFLPPVPLERRMWAGGRLTFHAGLQVGATMERRSEITKVSEKTGAAGPMVFVTVAHRVTGPAGLAVIEEQDIVFVSMPDRYVPLPGTAAPLPEWSAPAATDTVRLFRFSALTFNAHRIHFDLPYATGVEKYPGLVVHGPLQAMLLMGAAQAHSPGRAPAHFRFRGLRPAFHTDAMTVQGQRETAGLQALCTVNGDGHVCCQAEIGWS